MREEINEEGEEVIIVTPEEINASIIRFEELLEHEKKNYEEFHGGTATASVVHASKEEIKTALIVLKALQLGGVDGIQIVKSKFKEISDEEI